jgi:hypothetical protein
MIKAMNTVGATMKKFGASLQRAAATIAPFFVAEDAFKKLSREEQVAVRLRYGRDLTKWWLNEKGYNFDP